MGPPTGPRRRQLGLTSSPARLEAARDLIGPGGASCVDGLLVVRLVNADAAALRADFAQFWKMFRYETAGLPAILPRVWEV